MQNGVVYERRLLSAERPYIDGPTRVIANSVSP